MPYFLSVFHVTVESNLEILKLQSSKSIKLIREPESWNNYQLVGCKVRKGLGVLFSSPLI